MWRSIFMIYTVLWLISPAQAIMQLTMVWGWHNSTTYLAEETNTSIPIPSSVALTVESGGIKNYNCHSEIETDLDYNEICNSYSADLCIPHKKWTKRLLNESANYAWIKVHTRRSANPFHPGNPYLIEHTENKWSEDYDYTFEFFTEEHCLTPMLDKKGGPVQFTIDRAFNNDENAVKIAFYLVHEVKMPVSGFWRGSRKKKEGVAGELGHHKVTCTDSVFCTPRP